MAEPAALSAIVEPIGVALCAVFTGLASIHWSWWFSRIGSLVASLLSLPWKALLIPLTIISRILLFVFAPVIYVFSYLAAGVAAVLGFVAALEPLYTFFGVAAFIGVIAGLILALTSAFITSYLGIQEDGPSENTKRWGGRYLEDEDDSIRDDSSSSEADWQWPDKSPVTRRKPASGLLSQTIHEEDGSSDAEL